MLKKTIGMKGFTLAEVLITLGIIGVVAAMTMPTLINSTQGAQYKTAYKKALSVMSQAVVMNIALEDYDLSQTVAGTAQGEDAAGEPQTLFSLFRNRMNVVKVMDGSEFNTTDGDPDCWKIVSAGDTDYETFEQNRNFAYDPSPEFLSSLQLTKKFNPLPQGVRVNLMRFYLA